MLKLDGVRRSQVKELRHEARWLADRHPDVYGAVFIGRKLLPIEGLPVGPVSDRAGSPVLYEAPGPRLLALPVGVAPGQSPPAVACHESGVYGTKRDHHTVAFYGDREGYRRLVELAVSMRDMGVEYSTLGRLANFREWFAAGALLGYLLETAEHHNGDEMPIKAIEGTVEHSGWVGPITYYALRPSLTRATSRLLSGTLARDKMIGKAARAAESGPDPSVGQHPDRANVGPRTIPELIEAEPLLAPQTRAFLEYMADRSAADHETIAHEVMEHSGARGDAISQVVSRANKAIEKHALSMRFRFKNRGSRVVRVSEEG